MLSPVDSKEKICRSYKSKSPSWSFKWYFCQWFLCPFSLISSKYSLVIEKKKQTNKKTNKPTNEQTTYHHAVSSRKQSQMKNIWNQITLISSKDGKDMLNTFYRNQVTLLSAVDSKAGSTLQKPNHYAKSSRQRCSNTCKSRHSIKSYQTCKPHHS